MTHQTADDHSIDAYIGATSIVHLQRVVEPEMAEIWVKLEGSNLGGSIKDRTALAMIVDAEERGLLRAGDTIVGPTSGNTRIGLAQVASTRVSSGTLPTVLSQRGAEAHARSVRSRAHAHRS